MDYSLQDLYTRTTFLTLNLIDEISHLIVGLEA